MTKVDLPILFLPCCENVYHEIVSHVIYMLVGCDYLQELMQLEDERAEREYLTQATSK